MKRELLLSLALTGLISGNVMADHHEEGETSEETKMEKEGCSGKKEKHSCEGKNESDGKKVEEKAEGHGCGSNGCG